MSRLSLVAATLLLVGCGANELAGGGGIETNNTLSLKVTDPAGASVAGAVVRIRPYDWHGPDSSRAPGALGTTDSSGTFTAPVGAGRWVVEARRDGLGRMSGLRRYVMADTAFGLSLDTLGGLEGSVVLDSPAPIRLALGGTRRETVTDSLGRYRLDSLSPGPLLLRLLDGSGRTDSVQIAPGTRSALAWTGNPELRRAPDDGAVLLDDFRDSLPSLASSVPLSRWYLATDALHGGSSRITGRDGTTASGWNELLTGSSSASLGLELGTGTPPVSGFYAQVGLVFAPTGQCVDLTTLDSVSFLVRGSGSMRMDFRTALQDTVMDLTSCPGIDFQPTATWARMNVPASRLAPMQGSSHPFLTWTQAYSRDCVFEIRFIAQKTSTLELGDLVLHGPSRSTFLAPKVP